MIDRVRRFIGLFASRYQDYTELFAAQSLEETLAWTNRNRLLGFNQPGRPLGFGTYGRTRLSMDLVRGPLLCSGIQRVFFPAYPPELEQGIAWTGYAVLFRSSMLKNHTQNHVLPLNLLQSCEVADGRLSQSCASS